MSKLTSTMAMIAAMAVTLWAQVPTEGLVAFYPFTGNWNDVSGHGHNLTAIVQYAPTWTTDRNGIANQAVYFEGNRAGLQALADSFPLGSSARTISAWVQLQNLTRPRAIISWGDRTNKTDCSFLANTYSGYACLIFTNSIDSLIYKTSSLEIHSWTHLAVTLTATGLATMYMGDSILVSKQMSNWNTSAGLFGVGAWFGDQYLEDNMWSGKLDAVAIYKRALSAAEISTLSKNNTDQLIPTKVSEFYNTHYSLINAKPSNTYYTINGRVIAHEPITGMLVGAGLKKTLRIQ
jgi:hypothetical protein